MSKLKELFFGKSTPQQLPQPTIQLPKVARPARLPVTSDTKIRQRTKQARLKAAKRRGRKASILTDRDDLVSQVASTVGSSGQTLGA